MGITMELWTAAARHPGKPHFCRWAGPLIRAQNVPACTTTHRRDRHPATGLISLYRQTVQRVITHAWIKRELNDITDGTMFDFSLYSDQDGDSRI